MQHLATAAALIVAGHGGISVNNQRALGGPVRSGVSYKVGEHGVETLVTGQDGHILTNRDTMKRASGGGMSVGEMHLHFHGTDVTTESGGKQVAAAVVKQLRYQAALS